ncbi:hypothetical protein C8J56DRAFT_1158134 [Mycena floridula]|nr:hypothetical protein C8J56DRAFT_1158134 [Mycena floridula]
MFDGSSCNATIQSTGNTVAVYGVVDRAQAFPTVLTFYIDKQKQNVYFTRNNNPSVVPQYEYDVEFFNTTSLSSGSHELVIVNG